MIFNVVSPLIATIDGESLKEAIKNFIKINHSLNITNMIIKDQSSNIEAQIKYYQKNGRNKVGINMFPLDANYPIPMVNNMYMPNNIIQSNIDLWPLSPLPMSPYGLTSFIPTVVKIPTNL